jgi:hypothetical protein
MKQTQTHLFNAAAHGTRFQALGDEFSGPDCPWGQIVQGRFVQGQIVQG